MNTNDTTETAAAKPAGSTDAGAVQWLCTVTKAGAKKRYGSDRHLKGRGAQVRLTEAEAKAAEAQGWVQIDGISEG